MGLFDLFGSGSANDNPFDVSGFANSILSVAESDIWGGGSPYGGPATPVVTGTPVMSGSVPLTAAGAMIGRSMRQFPSLANALAALRARGVKATVESLWTMLKKFGPTALVSGGFMTAAAISDLMYYKSTHKRRRMNPANTRALRRSLRRLKSFDNLSHRVHNQLSASCRRGPIKRKRC